MRNTIIGREYFCTLIGRNVKVLADCGDDVWKISDWSSIGKSTYFVEGKHLSLARPTLSKEIKQMIELSKFF